MANKMTDKEFFDMVLHIETRLKVCIPRWEKTSGHVIIKHVEICDEELRTRSETDDCRYATKFFSYASALRLVSYTVAKHYGEIQIWCSMKPEDLSPAKYKRKTLKMQTPKSFATGYGFARRVEAPFATDTGLVVIERCGTSWKLITAYPTPSDDYKASKGLSLWSPSATKSVLERSEAFDWGGKVDIFDISKKNSDEFESYCRRFARH